MSLVNCNWSWLFFRLVDLVEWFWRGRCFWIRFSGLLLIWALHTYLLKLGPLQIGLLILLSLAVTFFDVIGDLAESMLKRNRHIKDSGALLPGHGGILDRVDGLIAVVPSFVLTLLLVLPDLGDL